MLLTWKSQISNRDVTCLLASRLHRWPESESLLTACIDVTDEFG